MDFWVFVGVLEKQGRQEYGRINNGDKGERNIDTETSMTRKGKLVGKQQRY